MTPLTKDQPTRTAHELIQAGYTPVHDFLGVIVSIYCPVCDNPLRKGPGFARKIDESEAWTGEDERYIPCTCPLS